MASEPERPTVSFEELAYSNMLTLNALNPESPREFRRRCDHFCCLHCLHRNGNRTLRSAIRFLVRMGLGLSCWTLLCSGTRRALAETMVLRRNGKPMATILRGLKNEFPKGFRERYSARRPGVRLRNLGARPRETPEGEGVCPRLRLRVR